MTLHVFKPMYIALPSAIVHMRRPQFILGCPDALHNRTIFMHHISLYLFQH